MFRPESGRPDGKTVRRRALLLSVMAGLCASCVIAAAVSGSFVCYAVSCDGEIVGTVSSRTELDAAIEEADAVAAVILGEDHPVIDTVAVTATLSSTSGNADELTGAILDNLEGIVHVPVLTVDGVPVAAMDSEESINAVLDGLLARFTRENTISARFIQKIGIETTYVGPDMLRTGAELAEMLDPENQDSPCRLTVVTEETAESLVTVPYDTQIIYDENAYSDERTIISEGQNGRRLDVTVTVCENGLAVTSCLSRSVTVRAPVDEVVSVGALPGSRTDSKGTYIWPTTGKISSGFGSRAIKVGSSNHKGIDIANDVGTDVWAADGGVVIAAKTGDNGGYGNMIKIRHDNGCVTLYAHLSSILVSEGDRVAQGDLIAEMGRSGNVTGPHLHFEIRPNGSTAVNPTKYLSGKPDRE